MPQNAEPTCVTEQILEIQIDRPYGIVFKKSREGLLCVKELGQDGPALAAGAKVNDAVVGIDTVQGEDFSALMKYLKSNPPTPTCFLLRRKLRGAEAGIQAVIQSACRLAEGHTVFEIGVASVAGSWQVYKRYSDFEHLHKQLSQPSVLQTAFPEKRWNSNSESVTEERVRKFQEYLKILFEHDEFANSELVDRFLGRGQPSLNPHQIVHRFESDFDLPKVKQLETPSSSHTRSTIDSKPSRATPSRPSRSTETTRSSERLSSKSSSTRLSARTSERSAPKSDAADDSIDGQMAEIDSRLSELDVLPPGYQVEDPNHPIEIQKRNLRAHFEQVSSQTKTAIDQGNSALKSQKLLCHEMETLTSDLDEASARFGDAKVQDKIVKDRDLTATRLESRLKMELEETTTEIVRMRGGLRDLQAQHKSDIAEKRYRRQELELQIAATECNHNTKTELRDELLEVANSVDKKIETTIAENEDRKALEASMTVFEENMQNELKDINQTQEQDRLEIEEFEKMLEDLEQAHEEATVSLQANLREVKGSLGALEEFSTVAAQHTDRLNQVETSASEFAALRDQELARIQEQAVEAEARSLELNDQRSLLKDQLSDALEAYERESDTIRASLNETVIRSSRTDNYAQKLDKELDAAGKKLHMHRMSMVKQQAYLEIATGQNQELRAQISQLDHEIDALNKELTKLKKTLADHDTTTKKWLHKVTEDLDCEEAVLQSKEETRSSFQEQLQHVRKGHATVEQLDDITLTQHCRAWVKNELETVAAVTKSHEDTRAEQERMLSVLEEELKLASESFRKESRDLQSRLEVDRRARALRAGYAYDMGLDTSSISAANSSCGSDTTPASFRGCYDLSSERRSTMSVERKGSSVASADLEERAQQQDYAFFEPSTTEQQEYTAFESSTRCSEEGRLIEALQDSPIHTPIGSVACQ